MSNLSFAIAPFLSYAPGVFGSSDDKNPSLVVKDGNKVYFVPLTEGVIDPKSKKLTAINSEDRKINYDASNLNLLA